jgi:hypothetical protein
MPRFALLSFSHSTHPLREQDPDWEFFLPDEEESYPNLDDFWIDSISDGEGEE